MNSFDEKIYSGIILEVVKSLLKESNDFCNWVKRLGTVKDIFGKSELNYLSRLNSHIAYTRFLGHEKPIPVDSIYTNLNLLEKVNKCLGCNITDLEKVVDNELKIIGNVIKTFPGEDLLKSRIFNFDIHRISLIPNKGDWRRIKGAIENHLSGKTIKSFQKFFDSLEGLLGKMTEDELRILVKIFEQTPRYIVLGKPGSGKTTFLKKIALMSINSQFEKKFIPFFISFKDFANSKFDDLFEFIAAELDNCEFPESLQFLENILKHNRVLLLLDGLDEISSDILENLLYQIEVFARKYSGCPIIITCRVAFYQNFFNDFIETEISDFNQEQVLNFSKKWFGAKKGNDFVNDLQVNINARDLAGNPFLLTLLCISYENNKRIPSHRCFVYEDAVESLWNRRRGSFNSIKEIASSSIGIRSVKDLLNELAIEEYSKGQIFFYKNYLGEYINLYLQKIVDDKTYLVNFDEKKLIDEIEWNIGIIIERARGIYSFSHLTIQEYLCAKHIVAISRDDQIDSLILNVIRDNRWREVFLLALRIVQKPLSLVQKTIDAVWLSLKDTHLFEYLNTCSHNSKFNMESANIYELTKFLCAVGNSFFIRGDCLYDRPKFGEVTIRSENDILKTCLDVIDTHRKAYDVDIAKLHIDSCGIDLNKYNLKFNKSMYCIDPLHVHFIKFIQYLIFIIDCVEEVNLKIPPGSLMKQNFA